MANLHMPTDSQIAEEVSIFQEAIGRCRNANSMRFIAPYVLRQFAVQVMKVRAKRALEK